MSAAFGGSRLTPKPPERGVFPLDHDGECKKNMKEYLECLKLNKQDNFPCRDLSKAYLACRMDRNLMASESLDRLGFREGGIYTRIEHPNAVEPRERKGFVAGTGVKSG